MSTPKNNLPKPAKAREALGLTATQLAEKVPCALQTVRMCEDGKHYPKHKALRAAYLRALGLSVAQ